MSTLTLPPAPAETPWLLATLGDPIVSFVVHGVPAPQGSKSFKGMREKKSTGKKVAILAESSKKVDPWRRQVARAAADAVGEPDRRVPLLPGALVADMVFTLAKPGRFPTGDLRREHGRPTTYPDVSKLVRSTEDALTKIVWEDDARVVSYRRLEKLYVGSEDPDALTEPGVVIRVWSVLL